MKIVNPSFAILSLISPGGVDEVKLIENAARVCYKSENLATTGIESAEKLIKNCISNGHESVLEHGSITVKVICDRGVSHELVRHREASYSQESTRYCNYSKDKFGNELTFIKPSFFVNGSEQYDIWLKNCEKCENDYFNLLKYGAKPEEARSILNNSLKTEIMITANYREWRHILKLRTSNKAHPQMREIMRPILCVFQNKIPYIFDDIEY